MNSDGFLGKNIFASFSCFIDMFPFGPENIQTGFFSRRYPFSQTASSEESFSLILCSRSSKSIENPVIFSFFASMSLAEIIFSFSVCTILKLSERLRFCFFISYFHMRVYCLLKFTTSVLLKNIKNAVSNKPITIMDADIRSVSMPAVLSAVISLLRAKFPIKKRSEQDSHWKYQRYPCRKRIE